MEPVNKVPLLRLCSLHLSPTEPINPSQIIESYLGVKLNSNYCYLSACLSDTICYIWSRRPKENEDISLQNFAQMKIFKKIIRLLKDDKPLSSLSDVSQEKYKVDIRYHSPSENYVFKNVECRAVLITAIFNERIVEKQSPLMRCYRDVLATVLEWHMQAFFKEESLLPVKSSMSCPTTIDDLKLSPGGRMGKRSSQSNLRRSMPWGVSYKEQEIPEKKDSSSSDSCQLLKDLKMDCLDHCRSFWLGITELKIEYLKFIDFKLLEKPQMGLLVEEELTRNIAFELVGEKLAHDIERNILHFSVNNVDTELYLSKVDTENNSYRFQELLKSLMIGLKIHYSKKEEIIRKWNFQLKKVSADLKNERLSDAIKNFFMDDLDPHDHDENNLRQLLILARQRMYVHPMTVIRAALKDIPMTFDNDHLSRVMSYQFNDELKYQVSHIAVVSKDTLSAALKNKNISPPQLELLKDMPPFELEMLNVMSASIDKLDAWSSNITIKLNLLSKKKRLRTKSALLEKICEPLQKLGFTVVII